MAVLAFTKLKPLNVYFLFLQLNTANVNGTKIFSALYKELFKAFENVDLMHFGGNGVSKIDHHFDYIVL